MCDNGCYEPWKSLERSAKQYQTLWYARQDQKTGKSLKQTIKRFAPNVLFLTCDGGLEKLRKKSLYFKTKQMQRITVTTQCNIAK